MAPVVAPPSGKPAAGLPKLNWWWLAGGAGIAAAWIIWRRGGLPSLGLGSGAGAGSSDGYDYGGGGVGVGTLGDLPLGTIPVVPVVGGGAGAGGSDPTPTPAPLVTAPASSTTVARPPVPEPPTGLARPPAPPEPPTGLARPPVPVNPYREQTNTGGRADGAILPAPITPRPPVPDPPATVSRPPLPGSNGLPPEVVSGSGGGSSVASPILPSAAIDGSSAGNPQQGPSVNEKELAGYGNNTAGTNPGSARARGDVLDPSDVTASQPIVTPAEGQSTAANLAPTAPAPTGRAGTEPPVVDRQAPLGGDTQAPTNDRALAGYGNNLSGTNAGSARNR